MENHPSPSDADLGRGAVLPQRDARRAGWTSQWEKARLASMRRVGVTELKDRLSYYLRLVKTGETVEVTERDVAIAVLTRLSQGEGRGLQLDDLIREGIVVAPQRHADIGELDRPAIRCDGNVAQAVVDARGDR
jgi:antitoxin (DNA-binding transcriptional repressor) of toxin-antitoxin stability system